MAKRRKKQRRGHERRKRAPAKKRPRPKVARRRARPKQKTKRPALRRRVRVVPGKGERWDYGFRPPTRDVWQDEGGGD